MAVIGYDDTEYGALVTPALTTVHIDAEARGRIAARTVLGLDTTDLRMPIDRLFVLAPGIAHAPVANLLTAARTTGVRRLTGYRGELPTIPGERSPRPSRSPGRGPDPLQGNPGPRSP